MTPCAMAVEVVFYSQGDSPEDLLDGAGKILAGVDRLGGSQLQRSGQHSTTVDRVETGQALTPTSSVPENAKAAVTKTEQNPRNPF